MSQCYVCQEEKELVSIVYHLESPNTECSHQFCPQCIDTWHQTLQVKEMCTTCPVCRGVICENGSNEASNEESQNLVYTIRSNNTDHDSIGSFLNPPLSITDSSFNERFYNQPRTLDGYYDNESVSDLASFSQGDDRVATFSKRELQYYKRGILELVRRDVTVLEFVSHDLRADRDFMDRAVAINQEARRYIYE